MIKNTRLCSMALGLVMLLSTLSACSGTTKNTPTSPPAATQAMSTAAPATASAAKESPYPSYLNLDGYRPIVKEGTNITLTAMTRRDTIATSDINKNHAVQFFKNVLNINLDIEEVNTDTHNERKNLMLASNDLKDIMFNITFSNADLVTYGHEEGMLLAMSDYFSETLTPAILASFEGEEFAVQSNTLPSGKMYVIPRFVASYPGFGGTINTQRIFINKNWMEGVGLTSPPETLDAFVAMLRAFKEKDPMGVGSGNIVPLLSSFGQDRIYLLNAFGWIGVGAEGNGPCFDASTKQMVIPCGEKNFAEYIKLMNTLYTEGLIHEDFFTIDRTGARALYVEGVVGVVADSAPYLSMPNSYKDYVSAVPLSSQYSSVAAATRGETFSRGNTVISAATKYPEVCMRLLDYMYTEEGSLYGYYGPPAGDDTLGIVSGFQLNEKGTNIAMPDVINRVRETDYDYRVNSIIIAQNAPGDLSKTDLYKLKVLGVANPSFPALNLDDGDDHYRYLVHEASSKYTMLDGLPTSYLGSDVIAELTDLQTVIQDYVRNEVARFIVGQRPLSEIDNYYKELDVLGYKRLKEIYTGLYANYISSIQ